VDRAAGNPVSTMVTFELFVRPAIRRLRVRHTRFRRTVPVIVREPITLGPKLRHYLRAIVDEGEARLTGPQGSGILTSMARANALLIVPAEMSTVPAGTELPALILDDPRHVAETTLLMAVLSSPVVRRALRLTGYLFLTLVVYWLNAVTPASARLGILYIIPVLLVTWTEGLAWGLVFAVATTGLREAIAWVQMPEDTPMVWRIVTGLAYLAVLGLAMAGLQTLRRREAQMARLITQDPLTNVMNARAFAERLGQELDRNRRYPRPLALMYMDLDNFKVINDTHGHQTGDAVLRLVADAMRSSCGRPTSWGAGR